MPAELRSRKPAAAAPSPVQVEEREKEKPKNLKKKPGPPTVDLEPNLFVMLGMIVTFFVGLFLLIYYKIDNRDEGPVAIWVNKQFPFVDRALNRPRVAPDTNPLFGVNAQSTSKGGLQLTEEELKQYTGEDGQPIYLGIDGKIFDVSASPAFYGPGGHYHHFVGKDATRAWVTECWDEPEQFTWRMDDVEVMFYPKWMDEQLEDVADGNLSDDLGDVAKMPQDMMAKMAKQAMEKFGKVDKAEKKKRRKEDQKEAEAKVQETLQHWVRFFRDNAKYKLVGSVVRDETRPDPPKPCKKAMEKRPMKGGKLEALTGKIPGMAGSAAGGAAEKPKGEVPEHIKKMLADKAKKGKEGAEGAAAQAKEGADSIAEQIKNIGKNARNVVADWEVQQGAQDAAENVKESAQLAKEGAEEVAAQASDAAAQAKESAEVVADQVKGSAKQAKAKAGESAQQAKEAADGAAEKVKDSAKQAKAKADETVQQAGEAADAAAEKVKGTAQQAKEGAEGVADKIKNTAQQAKERVEEVVYGSEEDEDLMSGEELVLDDDENLLDHDEL